MPKIIGERKDPSAFGPSPYIVEKDDGTTQVLPRDSVPYALRKEYDGQQKAAAAQAEADAKASKAADEKLRIETQGPNANDLAWMTGDEAKAAKAAFAERQAKSLAVPELAVSLPPEELVSRAPPPGVAPGDALATTAPPAQATALAQPQGTGGSGGGGSYSETQVLRPASVSGGGMTGASDIRAGTRMQAAGVDALTAATEREGVARAAQADAQRVQMEAMDAKEAERQSKVVAARDEQMSKIQRLTDSLAKEDGSISTSRWWNSRSSGQKVLAVLSATLSGFAGTTSPIYKAIDDDIAAQKDALDRRRDGKKDALAGANSLLAVMRTNGMDDAQAQLAAKAAYLQRAALEVDRLTANSTVEKVRANGEKLKGELLSKQGEALSTLADHAANREIQRQGLEIQRAELRLKAMGSGEKMTKVTAGEAAKVGDMDAALSLVSDLRKNFKDKTSLASFVAQYYPGSESMKYEDQRKVAAQIIGGILEGGKLSESDLPRYLDMIPSATTGETRGTAQLATMERQLRTRRAATLNSLGQAGYDTSGFPKSLDIQPPPPPKR